jgi:glutamyl-tRNA reductase
MSEIASMLVTHRKASIDEIERAWHGDVETILRWVGSQERVEECAVLKTCNRVEIYVVGPRGERCSSTWPRIDFGYPPKKYSARTVS